MIHPFKDGDQLQYEHTVTEQDLASFASGNVHPVYATFSVARDAEWCCRLFVLEMKEADEEGIGNEVAALIAELQSTRGNVWWIKEMLPHDQLTAMLTAADLFICPSIYEPLGIVNLEAMGCETAVLGSRVGGIPEVVADKETGELVDYNGEAAPFEKALTESITRLMSQPELLKKYGAAGRVRAQKLFGWDAVAALTVDLYRRVIA
mgnify:CR=1 FL=1